MASQDTTVGFATELKRDGTTIHSDVEISYVDAILGVTTPVRTVDGQVGRANWSVRLVLHGN
jgi:DnaJ-class molecular chaperone